MNVIVINTITEIIESIENIDFMFEISYCMNGWLEGFGWIKKLF
jgi:hypothetical protein